MTLPAARATTADAGRFGRIVRGRELRQEILDYGPAFLNPQEVSANDAFNALVGVLTAYALGSRTAARLVQQRQTTVPSWHAPARSEAMDLVRSLATIRQYLPHLLGQRVPRELAVALGRSPQSRPAKMIGPTRPIHLSSPPGQQPRGQAAQDAGSADSVVQRPIISISPGAPPEKQSLSATQRLTYRKAGS